MWTAPSTCGSHPGTCGSHPGTFGSHPGTHIISCSNSHQFCPNINVNYTSEMSTGGPAAPLQQVIVQTGSLVTTVQFIIVV